MFNVGLSLTKGPFSTCLLCPLSGFLQTADGTSYSFLSTKAFFLLLLNSLQFLQMGLLAAFLINAFLAPPVNLGGWLCLLGCAIVFPFSEDRLNSALFDVESLGYCFVI
ncbi:hypothetical protein ILYODFUR_027468 [Ilyodon furcidens]|uniref:Uncharacterized protein n=1 Tax=Ilyodon furcidens TaxID=33524 RepID=A0ABV0T1S4_9TELE